MFKFNLKKLAILLPGLLALSGCDSEKAFTETGTDNGLLSPFYIIDMISANDDSHVKRMHINWTSAANDGVKGINYHICQKDVSQENQCNELTVVTDMLEAKVQIPSLIEADGEDFFVIATLEDEKELTPSKVIPEDEVTKMIGYFKPSMAGMASFGNIMTLSEDGHVLAIGDPDNEQVHLYREVDDNWTFTQTIEASNGQSGDQFGCSLDLSEDGSVLIVGAPEEDSSVADLQSADNKEGDAGAAYIFSMNVNNEWQQTAYLKQLTIGHHEEQIHEQDNNYERDLFGFSVSISDDGHKVAIGAPLEESTYLYGISQSLLIGFFPFQHAPDAIDWGANSQGEVIIDKGATYTFIYNEASLAWEFEAYFKDYGEVIGDIVDSNIKYEEYDNGSLVKLSGDGNTLVVGGFAEGGKNDLTQERFNVYRIDDSKQKWKRIYHTSDYVLATDINTISSSVDVSYNGEVIAFGVLETQHNVIDKEPGVMIYKTKSDNSDYIAAQFIESGNSGFGVSVALNSAGDSLAVGYNQEASSAIGIDGAEEDTTATSAGAAYLYKLVDYRFERNAYIKAPNTEASDSFGSNISMSGDGKDIAISAPKEDSDALLINQDQFSDLSPDEDAGALYFY